MVKNVLHGKPIVALITIAIMCFLVALVVKIVTMVNWG